MNVFSFTLSLQFSHEIKGRQWILIVKVFIDKMKNKNPPGAVAPLVAVFGPAG